MNLPLVRVFRVFRVCLLLAFLWTFAPSRASAQATPPNIQKIEIVHTGPPAASEELIKANIRLKAGEPYLRSNADDDVRNLYGTGFFHNIRVGEEVSDAGVILTFFLQGKPTLTEIRFEGSTKFSRDKLLKKVSSKTGEPLNERKLFTDAEEIKKLYQKSGYQRTEVKYTVSIDEKAGRGIATIEIKESPKIRVVDIEFVGAQAFPQKKLRKEIKTHRWWMFSWITGTGKLKDEEFEEERNASPTSTAARATSISSSKRLSSTTSRRRVWSFASLFQKACNTRLARSISRGTRSSRRTNCAS